MTWIIIVLVVAVIVGPIMYLVPTPKDKRLTALRLAARKAGLVVKITSVPKLDPTAAERVTAGGKALSPTVQCSAYELPLPQGLVGVGALMLLRLPDEPTVTVNEVLHGWSLYAEDHIWDTYSVCEQSLTVLRVALDKFPPDSLAVAINDRFVACYWRERAVAEDGTIAQIQQALASVAEDLVARFG